MGKSIVVYNTATALHRAAKLFKKKRIRVRVLQLPGDLGLQGCSYGLECDTSDMPGVLAYSAEKMLAVKAAFAVSENERGREYTAYDLS